MKMPSFVSCCLAFLIAAPVLAQSAGIRATAAGDRRLVIAVKNGDKEAARALLKQKVDVNAALADGGTALHWAAHLSDLETAELLVRAGAKVSTVNDYGVSPLSLACTNANAAMVELLLKAGADAKNALPSGETVLMTCARAGSADAVKALLARGADANAKHPEHGQTALMWTAAQKHPEAVRALIEGGADVRARSKSGFTPLLFAARAGDVETARALLAGGADVNETMPVRANPMRGGGDDDDAPVRPAPAAERPMGAVTPLLIASAGGHEALAIFFLEQGADPNAVDGTNGATALHYALLRGITLINGVQMFKDTVHLFRPNMTELAKALVARRTNPNARHGKNPPIVAGSGADAIGATPLLVAAASGDPGIMRLLLANGADPTLGARGGMTPLMAASGLKRDTAFTEPEERGAVEAVKLLLELGADVNATDEDGLTALHAAAIMGSNPIVQALAERGAKLDVRDKHQQTPLTIASGMLLPWVPKSGLLGEVRHKSTEDLLLQLGATAVSTPGYFTEVEESDAVRLNPRGSMAIVPGAKQ